MIYRSITRPDGSVGSITGKLNGELQIVGCHASAEEVFQDGPVEEWFVLYCPHPATPSWSLRIFGLDR
jgi:hypothetical protein